MKKKMDYVIGVDIGTQSTKALLVGTAHADLWMQIISDVTGYTVYTIREEVEAALGASLLTASGAGVIDSAAVEQGWIRLDERTRPRPEVHARYERQFKLYCDLYPSLKNVMHGLQENAA